MNHHTCAFVNILQNMGANYQRTSMLFILLAFFGQHTLAENQQEEKVPYYNIEVIIFENLHPQVTESFDTPVNLPFRSDARQLTESVPADQNQIRLLPKGQHGLQSQALSIRRSADFRLLSHLSWMVVLHYNKTATFVIPTSTDTERLEQLGGSVSIRRSRYLRFEADLLLTTWAEPEKRYFDEMFNDFGLPDVHNRNKTGLTAIETGDYPLPNPSSNQILVTPTPPTVSESDRPAADNEHNPLAAMGLEPHQYFHLHTARRMRSKELHYLDHPRFGMLVYIKPVEEAK